MPDKPPAGQPEAPPASIEIVVPARNEARRLPDGLAALCRKAAALPLRAADPGRGQRQHRRHRRCGAGLARRRRCRSGCCAASGRARASRCGLACWPPGPRSSASATRTWPPTCPRPGPGGQPARRRAARGHRLAGARCLGRRGSGAARSAGPARRCSARWPAGSCPAPPTPSAGSSSSPGRWPGRRRSRCGRPGFAFDIELIARCQRLGATLTEIPVRWRDVPGSTFSVQRHSPATFRDVGHRSGSAAAGRRAEPAAPGARRQRCRPGCRSPPASLPLCRGSRCTRPGRARHEHRRRISGTRDPQPRRSDLGGARIAIVNWRDPWHPQAGGAERYAWEMARGLTGRGAAVSFLTARAPGQARREQRDGIDDRQARRPVHRVPAGAAGWLLAHRRSFDAVLDCQNGIPFFTPLVLPPEGAGAVRDAPRAHALSSGAFRPGGRGRAAARGAGRRGGCYRRHACVAVSPSTVAAMRERLAWTGDIYLIPNGDRPAGRPAAPSPGPAAKNLIWVGRLVAHKRAEPALGVAERLRRRPPPDRPFIDVVGRGRGWRPGRQVSARGAGRPGPAARLPARGGGQAGAGGRLAAAPEHLAGRGLGAVRAGGRGAGRAHGRLRRGRPARRGPRRGDRLAGPGRRAHRGRGGAGAEGTRRPGPPGARIAAACRALGRPVRLGCQRGADGRADQRRRRAAGTPARCWRMPGPPGRHAVAPSKPC